jgi:hypothetical protein
MSTATLGWKKGQYFENRKDIAKRMYEIELVTISAETEDEVITYWKGKVNEATVDCEKTSKELDELFRAKYVHPEKPQESEEDDEDDDDDDGCDSDSADSDEPVTFDRLKHRLKYERKYLKTAESEVTHHELLLKRLYAEIDVLKFELDSRVQFNAEFGLESNLLKKTTNILRVTPEMLSKGVRSQEEFNIYRDA